MADTPQARSQYRRGVPGLVMLVAILGGLALGFGLGLTAPVIYVVIGPGVYGGFTSVGYVFLAAAAAACLSIFVAVIPGARSWAAVAFLMSGAIAGGTLLGNWAAPKVGMPWAVRMTAPLPTNGPLPGGTLPPFPLTLEAPGTVRLTLTGVSDVSIPSPGPYDGGTFGHWCYSAPNGLAVAEIDVIDAVRLRDHLVWLDLWLIAPSGPIAPSMAVPRVALQVRSEKGVVGAAYSGVGTIVEGGDRTGRLTFVGLRNDQPSIAWPESLDGEIIWTCQPWPSAS